MGLTRKCRVRMHLVGDMGSLEGLLLSNPRSLGAHYKLVDAAFLESRVDKHDLDSLAVYVPRENVRFYEVMKP